MITVVPPLTPMSIPDEDPIVATGVLLLLHVPNGVASVKVDIVPAHSLNTPVIGAGNGSTVTMVVVIQVNGDV